MTAVIQRVTEAQVVVEGQVVGAIGPGLAVLVAVERGDTPGEAAWVATKLAGLRIFPDASGARAFDLDVRQAGGSILLVSNFTVAADCQKGRRPSLDPAAAPGEAEALFNHLVAMVAQQDVTVATGRFGASMKVTLTNDGPVTFILRTPER